MHTLYTKQETTIINIKEKQSFKNLPDELYPFFMVWFFFLVKECLRKYTERKCIKEKFFFLPVRKEGTGFMKMFY